MYLRDVLKTFWKRLEDVLKTFLQDVLKTSWRYIDKTNILVLTKTSWRRLHQDECLLGAYSIYARNLSTGSTKLLLQRYTTSLIFLKNVKQCLWRRGVVIITTAQFYSTKPELRLCAGSNPAVRVSEIRDGEDIWQWSL